METKELAQEEAIALYNSKWWLEKSPREIVAFQLFTERLCLPFDVFHESVEKTLGRPVFTHEFAFADNLKKEFLGERSSPTFEEVMNLIPESKRVLVIVK